MNPVDKGEGEIPPKKSTPGITASPTFQGVHIRDEIRFVDKIINEDYESFDRDACRQQRYDVLFAHVAVFTGTAAIIIAILQLTNFLPRELSLPGETVATLLSMIAVVAGMMWAFQRQWLLDRYKAESLRILRFKSLFQSDLLCRDTTLWETWLRGEVARIRSLRKEDLHTLIKSGGYPPVSSTADVTECNSDTVAAVAEYFIKNLIAPQILYFRRKADEQESSDRWIRHLPHLLFFIGVIIVALHFILNYLLEESGNELLGNFLILLGVGLPVIGMGIRTYRSSHEFARNAAIFRSKENRLTMIEAEIASLLEDQPENKMLLLSRLYICEDLLEEEHYEWLRLMTESEWFL